MRRYYNRAMDEVGFEARDSCLQARRDLKELWARLQPVLLEAERVAGDR